MPSFLLIVGFAIIALLGEALARDVAQVGQGMPTLPFLMQAARYFFMQLFGNGRKKTVDRPSVPANAHA